MDIFNKYPCGAEIATTEELCEMCKLRKRLDEVDTENKRLREAVRKLMYYAEYALEIGDLTGFNPEDVRADIDFAREDLDGSGEGEDGEADD